MASMFIKQAPIEEKDRLAGLLNQEILSQVKKPGRYTDQELNAVHKDWAAASIKIALGYPDAYEIGMANLGLQIFYDIFNAQTDALAERFYAPWPDLAEKLRQHGLALFSLESWTPLKYFDLVCFTLPSELNFTNILEILDLSGIPIEAADRTLDHPIILGGGSVTANPEPIADFFDALVIGEGEEIILEILAALKKFKEKIGDPADLPRDKAASQKSRREFLKTLAQIPGVYVPAFYQVKYRADGLIEKIEVSAGVPARVIKRYIQDLDRVPLTVKPLVPYLEVIHQRVCLEIMRGCPHQCRFCQARVFSHPVRSRSLPPLYEAADACLKNTGYDEISLLSLSSTDHPKIETLIQILAQRYSAKRVSLALPSSRADSFSVALATSTQQVRQTGITLAPEVGSQRLRDIIGKDIKQEEIFEAVKTALAKGVGSLKLYFMVGLPGEIGTDLDALVEMVLDIHHLGGVSRGKRFGLTVNLSPFVPKPQTAFQWVEQQEPGLIQNKLTHLKKNLKRRGLNLRWGDPLLSHLEGILTRGDRRLGRVIKKAWQKGAKFEAWVEYFKWDIWQAALKEENLDIKFYTRQRGLDEILPWDHIDLGQSRDYLVKEYQKALA